MPIRCAGGARTALGRTTRVGIEDIIVTTITAMDVVPTRKKKNEELHIII